MPSIDDVLHRFDSETSRRQFGMRLAGDNPAEIAEYTSYREDRRRELIRELESERVVWRS